MTRTLREALTCKLTDAELNEIEAVMTGRAMTNTPSLDEDRELTPQFATMNGRDKWETLVLHGLMGTDEPWVEALTKTLREEADRLESLLSDRAKLEEALQRLEQIVGITLDKDFGFWSSSAQNERRAELYPAWVYAKRTLDALNRSTDLNNSQR